MASSSNGERKRARPDGRRRPSAATDEYIMIGPNEPFAIPPGMSREEAIRFFQEAEQAAKKVIALYGDGRPADGIPRASHLPNSCHRDGSIYTVNFGWHVDYCISDRTETQLEPMMLAEPTDCQPNRETCDFHFADPMMQIFSLKLAKISSGISPIQLYGYLAVRDIRDSGLNYIFNRSRDDPITINEGSLIEMTGPKRGIGMSCDVLIEYDMKIKKGGKEEEDLQLIDGVSDYSAVYNTSCKAFMNRIDGDGGSVDITLALIRRAVEAMIEVVVSEVYNEGFDLCLSSFVSGIGKEIQLFHGVVDEPCGLRRSVVAVALDTLMELKFKVCHGCGEIERCANFKAIKHGSVSQDIKFDQASISVKVTWSTLL
ncbi:uncharacterized protein LOC100837604 isoform X1 [Brachypodium distachyon]|uniref:DUF6598 domain-containing protein n=1 Tax=Brachypodium distachyon TaxID=15368 RepID=A0A0Q3HFP2_BRADI|nr:uncharacterized protein LOC100837604 isoform X1 [Brachypodium distachyon]KQJ92298.1 hypothetical protein BRADI_4g42744v3 [Brachypodium distachyon]|eukprot:XP_003577058.1 uncharacterized protein LOC100837604 isoform X1 [Brachypodium distachyon]